MIPGEVIDNDPDDEECLCPACACFVDGPEIPCYVAPFPDCSARFPETVAPIG